MKKDLGRCRLHLCLQTSMTSIPSSNSGAQDASCSGSGSSDPSPAEESLGTDFEKLSLTLHQNLQNLTLKTDSKSSLEGRYCEDAPPWFINYVGKMEENLRQTIRQEVRQCLKDVLKEHFSSQTSAGSSSERHQDSTLNGDHCMPETSSSVRPKDVTTTVNEPVHLGITCDHCEQPVSGIRFKCGNCVDYDLCEACENIPGVHHLDHVFLKIRRPTYLATCREKGERRKSLLRHLYPQYIQNTIQGAGNESYRCRKREKKVKRWLTHAENYFSNTDRCNHRVGLLSGGRTQSGYLIGYAHSQSLHERHNAQMQNHVPPASKRCLTDLSSGTTLIVQPGQEFEKEWIVRNDSGETFSESFRLRFSWGSLVPQGQVEVSVPPLKPGESGTVGPVLFRAPQQEGLYHSHWLLVSHPGAKPFHWPYLSCPVRVSWQKESLQEENKEADTESTPLNKTTPLDSTEKLKATHLNDLDGKTHRSATGNNNNNNTTDPEETDDTASILSISSCESDEDYVKVQGPTQLGFSTTTLLTKTQGKSSGSRQESQATSSSSIDLLPDMPQFEDENGQRLPGDSARSPAASTVAVESSLPNSTSRSSIGSLNERHFTAPSETTMSTSGATQGNTEVPVVTRIPTPVSQPTPQTSARPDQANQPEVVIPVLPEGLVTGALTAAASVYNTARAIISTLQPPTDHHGSSDNQFNQGPPGPLALLIEMGFHDRDLNQRLLMEKGGCLEDVIAELIRLRPDRSLNID